jgi:hypothetical protein
LTAKWKCGCEKAGIGRKVRHKNHVSLPIFNKAASKKKSLIVQGDFGNVIGMNLEISKWI